MTDDELIGSLPHGDIEYVRRVDGSWDVAIFTPGSTHVIMTVASGMDKNVACWLKIRLKEARIDTSDIPEADEAWFKAARLREPMTQGDIIEIVSPPNWAGCLAVVDQVRSFGCRCFVSIPEKDGTPPSRAYIRLQHGEFKHAGAKVAYD